jgi:hypothetical protein
MPRSTHNHGQIISRCGSIAYNIVCFMELEIWLFLIYCTAENIPYSVGKGQWRVISFNFWNFIPQIYIILIFIICIKDGHYSLWIQKCWLNITKRHFMGNTISTTSASSDTTNHTWLLRHLHQIIPGFNIFGNLYLPLNSSILYLPIHLDFGTRSFQAFTSLAIYIYHVIAVFCIYLQCPYVHLFVILQ